MHACTPCVHALHACHACNPELISESYPSPPKEKNPHLPAAVPFGRNDSIPMRWHSYRIFSCIFYQNCSNLLSALHKHNTISIFCSGDFPVFFVFRHVGRDSNKPDRIEFEDRPVGSRPSSRTNRQRLESKLQRMSQTDD